MEQKYSNQPVSLKIAKVVEVISTRQYQRLVGLWFFSQYQQCDNFHGNEKKRMVWRFLWLLEMIFYMEEEKAELVVRVLSMN